MENKTKEYQSKKYESYIIIKNDDVTIYHIDENNKKWFLSDFTLNNIKDYEKSIKEIGFKRVNN